MMYFRFCVVLLVCGVLIQNPSLAMAADSPQDSQITIFTRDKLRDRVRTIFARLVQVADSSKDVDLKLEFVDQEGTPWAQAIRGGSIILTHNAVQFCYKDKNFEKGDARIAFILGHELAHQVTGDFWASSFFQALHAEEKDNPEYRDAFSEVLRVVGSPENSILRELKADQKGLIYASLAGYRVDLLISGGENFFREIAYAMHIEVSPDYPTPEQRARETYKNLKLIVSKLPLFAMGVTAYHVGKYKESAQLLEAFKRHYQGREVYSNLGAAYLRLALENYIKATGNESFPFQLAIGIDPFTKAGAIRVSGGGFDYKKAFEGYLKKALENLQKGEESDPAYPMIKTNLGAAHILRKEYHFAIGWLNQSIEMAPGNWQAYNNRGIANFFLKKKRGESDMFSEDDFLQAEHLSNNSPTPVFNLSKLYKGLGETIKAQKKHLQYTQMVRKSPFFLHNSGAQKLKESLISVTGLYVGKNTSEFDFTKKGWGKIFQEKRIILFHNIELGVSALTYENIVRLIGVDNGGGVLQKGSSKEQVALEFGTPDKKSTTGLREIWLHENGVGAQFVDNVLHSSFLF